MGDGIFDYDVIGLVSDVIGGQISKGKNFFGFFNSMPNFKDVGSLEVKK